MTEDLGACSISDCPNQADRRTAHGPLCAGHRKRLQPSRAGGKKLFESIAKREEFLHRWREVALEYGNADLDEEFDRAERKMLALLQTVAGDGSPEVAKASAELAEARTRSIRRGMAQAATEGRRPGPRPSITGEQLAAALRIAGSVSGAARLLGRPRRTVQKAMRRNGHIPSHGRMHTQGGKPSVPAQEHPEVHQGEVHAAEAREEQGRVRVEREGNDEERSAAEASGGGGVPRSR